MTERRWTPEQEELIARLRERAKTREQQPRLALTTEQEQQAYRELPWYYRAGAQFNRSVVEPWAALVTSPFLNKRQGEMLTPEEEKLNWYDRARLKYRKWEPGGPGFMGQSLAKFAIESTNPAFWIPWGGAVGKAGSLLGRAAIPGAAAAGRGLSLAGRGITAAETVPGRMVGGAIKGAAKPLVQPLARTAIGQRVAASIPKRVRPEFIKPPIEAPEAQAERLATGQIPSTVDYPGLTPRPRAFNGVLQDISSPDEVIWQASEPTRLRQIANMPGLKGVSRLIGGMAATAKNAAEFWQVGRNMLRAEGQTKAILAMAPIESIGSFRKVFKPDADGLISLGGMEGITQEELIQLRHLFKGNMTDQQWKWVEAYRKPSGALKELYAAHDIPLKVIVDEDLEWVGRRAMSKVTADGEIDVAFIGAGPGRPGAKAAFEKHRWFPDERAGREAGYKYMDLDEALALNIRAAYNRVADEDMARWFINTVSSRGTAAPEALTMAKQRATLRVGKAEAFETVVKEAFRGGSPPWQTVRAIKKVFPEQAEALERAMSIPVPEFDAALRNIGNEIWGQAKITRARFKAALEMARMKRAGREPSTGSIMRVLREGESLDFSKPHGLYFTIGAKSPHRDLGGRIARGYISAKKIMRVPQIEVRHSRGQGSLFPASAGVSALRELVGEAEFNRLLGLGKTEMLSELRTRFPGPDYSKYYDAYELLEAYGGQEARRRGYEAILQEVKDAPEWSEYVALSERAVKEVAEPSLGTGGKNIAPGELTETLDLLNVDTKASIKMLEAIYKEAHRFAGAERKETIKGLIPQAKALITSEREALEAASNAVSRAREQALQTHIGEGRIMAPAFQGRIFTGPEAQETVRFINNEIEQQGSNFLTSVNKVNAIGRYFSLAGDVSLATIQLLFLAGAQPKTFGKAMKGMVQGILDEKFLPNYLAKEADTIRLMPNIQLAYKGNIEPTEAFAKGGILQTKGVRKLMKPLEMAQQGFEAGMTVAGVEMGKALKHLATNPERAAQVAAFINEFRGLANTQRIGVSLKQRQMETAILIAPRYNRAIASLMADIFRGNLRGELARNAFAASIASITGATIAISLLMGESPDEILEHLDPRSNRFMTWEIAGQNIGPGTKVRSLLVLAGSAFEDPSELLELSMENPALRFLRGNLSPAVSTGYDLLTGKDYIGDPTRENALQLTDTVLAQNMLPIWMQSVLLEKGTPMEKLVRGAGEFAGLRTYPQSPWQQYQSLLEEVSGKRIGNLSPSQRTKLERENPMLAQLRKEASDEFERRGFDEESTTYWNSRKTAQEKRLTRLKAADAAYRRGEISGSALREIIQNSGRDLGAQYEQIDADFPDVTAEMEQNAATKERTAITQGWIEDWAYQQYWNIMFSPDLEDELGRVNYADRDARLSALQQQVGPEAWQYVQETISESRSKLPLSVQQYYQAQETLKPYWGIEDAIWQRYPAFIKAVAEQSLILESTDPVKARRLLAKYPQVLQARRMVALAKRRMRLTRPDINQALQTWY